jgi:phage-related protein
MSSGRKVDAGVEDSRPLSRRFWRYYIAPGQDKSVVKQELRALGPDASASLAEAMARYRDGESRRGEVKKLSGSDGLFEIRVQIGTNPYRVLFCHDGPALLAVLAIYKNQEKLERPDIELAKDRKKIWFGNKSPQKPQATIARNR